MKSLKELNDNYILLGLIVLQLILTLPFINSFPVDLDEPFSIFYAQQDLTDLVNLFANENNPPLHFILLHYWIKIFGISPLAVRSLSLIFNLLTIPLLYKFARNIIEKRYALLLVGFFIFSTFNHYHAIEARVYSLFVLLYVSVCYLLFELIFSSKNVWLKLSVVNALLLYAHYLGVFIIGIEVILILFFYKKITIKKLKQLIISFFLTVVLYIPGLYFLFVRLGDFTKNGTWVPEPKITEIYGNVIHFFNYNISFTILFLLFIIFLYINKNKVKQNFKPFLKNTKYHFIFLSFFLPYIGLFVFSILIQPVFLDRYLLFTTPFLYFSFVVFIKLILTDLNQKYIILFIIPMILSCYYIPKTNRDAHKIANFIKKDKIQEKCIAIYPPFYNLTFLYHYDKNIFKDYKNVLNNNYKIIQPVYSFQDLNIDSNCKTLYFLDVNSKFLYPGNNFLQILKEHYQLEEEKKFLGDYMVYKFKI